MARGNKAKPENQEAETNEMSKPEEKPESSEKLESEEKPESEEESGESAEERGAEGNGDDMVLEKPKTLIAMRPILYLARQYKVGESLPVNNKEMVEAWIEAGSAEWREKKDRQFFP